MDRDNASVSDIVKAAQLVDDFTVGLDFDTFQAELRTQLAVLHLIALIGEAVKRLSKDFRSRYPDVPWRKIAGMRDVVLHRYDDVDLTEVWHVVTVDAPDLLARLAPLTQRQEADQNES